VVLLPKYSQVPLVADPLARQTALQHLSEESKSEEQIDLESSSKSGSLGECAVPHVDLSLRRTARLILHAGESRRRLPLFGPHSPVASKVKGESVKEKAEATYRAA
jgi:hypothetical protein